MRNKLFSLMAVLLFSVAVTAQTSLKGRVIDESTQAPVVGAKITLANQNISTTTNSAGEFSLLYLEPMDEEVLIEADGYIAALELVNLLADKENQLDAVSLQQDIVVQAQDEILLNLTEEEMSDDEGRSQAQASSSSASTDVFNANTSFAWSTARYRNRGYQSNVENYYIEGLHFNSQERGQFNYSAMGGLNDASRYKEVLNPMEATNFTFGGIGQSTNYLMGASRYAQGWKVGAAGTNRNYKARVNATYSSGVLANGWAFIILGITIIFSLISLVNCSCSFSKEAISSRRRKYGKTNVSSCSPLVHLLNADKMLRLHRKSTTLPVRTTITHIGAIKTGKYATHAS